MNAHRKSFRPVAGLFLLTLLYGCSSQPRLSMDATQAELPYTAVPVVVDGQIETTEWATARSLNVDLPDGRRIEVLFQRDRTHFHFAFVGLGEPASRPVRPEILLDLWGNQGTRWSDDDWWIRIGEEDCWARGGFGAGDCRVEQAGLIANNFPIGPGEAVEVSVEFERVRFQEAYDGEIGLAFRFVDETGSGLAVWPLRAEAADPSTWAPLSLVH